MKKTLSLFLALVLALALAVPAFAAGYTEVIPPQYDRAYSFSEGLAAVEKDGKFGFIDKTGKVVIPFQYDRAYSFSEGLAAVELDWKYGFIDKTGKTVIPFQYESAESFSEGLAAVALDWNTGFIDKTGKTVIPFQYAVAQSFSEGLAAVLTETAPEKYYWGYIDKTGKTVVPFQYDYDDYIALDFKNGVTSVSSNTWEVGAQGNDIYLDNTGREISFNEYFEKRYDGSSDGMPESWVMLYRDDKVGIFDTATNAMIVPYQYESIRPFSDGVATVYLDEKYGAIDMTGKEIIPCRYDYISDFSEGVASAELNGKYGMIDKTGKEVVPFVYDVVSEVSDGLARVGKDLKYGFIAIHTASAVPTAYARSQSVELDGKAVTLPAYALKDANGYETNYVKLRDLASLLNGTAAQFNVGWDGAVNIESKTAYAPNGSEMTTPFSGDRAYQVNSAAIRINGASADLQGIVLTDDAGGGYTYFKLRDVGAALGFNVGWSAERGIYLESGKPYAG